MPLENFKRWHWLLISIVIGLAGAWIMSSMGPRPSVQARTVGAQRFEGLALRRPAMGMLDAPTDDSIDVYPSEGGLMALVTLSVPVTPADVPKGVPARLVRKYGEHAFRPQGKPYVPITQLATPPHFRLNFQEVDVDLPRLEKATRSDPGAWFEAKQLRDRLPTRLSGLTPAGVGTRRIGEGGACLEFPLQRNPAQLTIIAVDSKSNLNQELSASMNGKSLPPLTRSKSGPAAHWTTTVPVAALVDGSQTLKITGRQTPVAIAGVEVINPNYSLVDFLADAKKVNPKLQYVFHTSWQPGRMYPIWIVGSVLMIGVVWPTVIQILVSAGLAKKPVEPIYDLDRFKSNEKAQLAEPTLALQDDDELRRLEEEMERRLKEGAEERTAPATFEGAPEPIKELNAEVKEMVPATSEESEEKVFGGEYYPVVKKVERVDRKGTEPH